MTEAEPARILRQAAAIVRDGWSKGSSARNANGSPITSVAGLPPNATKAEEALSPVSFDVNAAMFRACSQRRVPKGLKKEDTRLLYFRTPERNMAALNEARSRFCLVAKTMHPSIWNDEVCKSGEEAAAMLEAAAASFGSSHV